jgi:hypothetical protein
MSRRVNANHGRWAIIAWSSLSAVDWIRQRDRDRVGCRPRRRSVCRTGCMPCPGSSDGRAPLQVDRAGCPPDKRSWPLAGPVHRRDRSICASPAATLPGSKGYLLCRDRGSHLSNCIGRRELATVPSLPTGDDIRRRYRHSMIGSSSSSDALCHENRRPRRLRVLKGMRHQAIHGRPTSSLGI